jgi:hypothetical protein
MKKIVNLLFVLFFGYAQAQQLNCTVQVNADKVTNANTQIFKSLENAINEFVNKTDWTGDVYKQNERINCSMVINVNSYDSNQFSATIQVQSSRPIFNSTYSSPIFNFNDKDFGFRYIEFENLIFNPNSFDSNLVSVLAFYSYMIIGFDADSYSLKGGNEWYQIAQEITNVSQQSGYKGWSQTDGNQNRYFLISDILSTTFEPFRTAIYQFHREGLDTMSKDLKTSKESIVSTIQLMSKLYSVRPNAFLIRVFFDAKADEIVSIFSGGPSIPISDLVDTLNKVSPINSSKWATIKL